MQIVSSVAAMQQFARKWRRTAVRVGLVPTMGYLHEGHLSLIRLARRHVGRIGRVVVSIYVNPTQFGPSEDFTKYPRDLKHDLKLCRAADVDVVFAPSDAEMYPMRPSRKAGRTAPSAIHLGFGTHVVEEKLSRMMEGVSRPMHFRGVMTVVAKLFNIVLPDVAILGAKDFQQAAVIKRMAAELNFPVKIVAAPTVRDADGLAISSRNKFLVGDLRRQAVVLWHAIQRAQTILRKSSRSVPASRLKADLAKFIKRMPTARLDYVEFFDPDTLLPVAKIGHGTHMALAVFVGRTRLIDNAKL